MPDTARKMPNPTAVEQIYTRNFEVHGQHRVHYGIDYDARHITLLSKTVESKI
jgi:hypothetical protein